MENGQTYGNDKYVGVQLLRADAINVAAADIQGNGEYNVEQLANWDPDVILVQDRYPALYEQIMTDPAYAELRAVKEGRVYVAPPTGQSPGATPTPTRSPWASCGSRTPSIPSS